MIPFKNIVEVHRISTVKNNATEGFFNVFIFRKISIIISWFLGSLRIHPNWITTVSFGINIFSGILLLVDFQSYKLLAIILFALGTILDMCDGEVARLTNKKSAFGAFYDPFIDRITDIIFPFLLGIGFLIQQSDRSIVLILFMGAYLGAKAALIFLDAESGKFNLNNSLTKIRELANSSSIGLDSKIKKYVKWDGGFSIILFTISIFFDQILILFVFLSIFFVFRAIFDTRNIFKFLLNRN